MTVACRRLSWWTAQPPGETRVVEVTSATRSESSRVGMGKRRGVGDLQWSPNGCVLGEGEAGGPRVVGIVCVEGL